ncbi:MAG: hypothetical protein LBH82_07125 [Bacteroidales bacterium]|jgi:hypothetical protein|nr:hypothetical protein [Bacteroidales bacterium]
MNTFELLDEKIQNMNDEQIIKTKKSPLQPVVIILAAIALLVSGIVAVNNETLAILLVVAGIGTSILGIIMLATNTGKGAFDYVYQPAGKKLKKYRIYLNEQDARIMVSCIGSNDFKKVSQLKKSLDTGHLLHCRATSDASIFLFQLLEYIPHDYVASSPVIVLRGEDARLMLQLVQS